MLITAGMIITQTHCLHTVKKSMFIGTEQSYIPIDHRGCSLTVSCCSSPVLSAAPHLWTQEPPQPCNTLPKEAQLREQWFIKSTTDQQADMNVTLTLVGPFDLEV